MNHNDSDIPGEIRVKTAYNGQVEITKICLSWDEAKALIGRPNDMPIVTDPN